MLFRYLLQVGIQILQFKELRIFVFLTLLLCRQVLRDIYKITCPLQPSYKL